MNFAVDAKVAGIITEKNLNSVQQLMTLSKTTLRPSLEALHEIHL